MFVLQALWWEVDPVYYVCTSESFRLRHIEHVTVADVIHVAIAIKETKFRRERFLPLAVLAFESGQSVRLSDDFSGVISKKLTPTWVLPWKKQ
ncbi:hypothetical protein ScPMuIL_018113 [Solemya velum]